MKIMEKNAGIVLLVSSVVLLSGVFSHGMQVTINNNTTEVVRTVIAQEEKRCVSVVPEVVEEAEPVIEVKVVRRNGYDRDIDHILRNEGGYSNDPDDPGGETYAGISRRHHPKSWIWVAVDKAKEAHGGSLPNNYKLRYVRKYLIKFYTRYLSPLDTSGLDAEDTLIAKELYVNAGPGGCARIMSRFRKGGGSLSDHVQNYYQDLYDRGRRHSKYLRSDMRRFGITLRARRRG